jgi:hypothetical protein
MVDLISQADQISQGLNIPGQDALAVSKHDERDAALLRVGRSQRILKPELGQLSAHWQGKRDTWAPSSQRPIWECCHFF